MLFCQFFRKGWDGHALLVRPTKTHHSIWKILLFWVRMNIYKDWQAKLESAYSFIQKYYEITVWRIKKKFRRMYVPGVGLKGALFVAAWDLCSSWGSSVVVSLPIFCPPLCTKRSAKDLGLNVVVVRFGGGGALENWQGYSLRGIAIWLGVKY